MTTEQLELPCLPLPRAEASKGMPLAQPDPGGRRRTTGRYTDVGGIADHLGLTVRHIRRLVFERRIPHRKVGSLLRFDIAEVDAWMDTLRRGPDPGSAA